MFLSCFYYKPSVFEFNKCVLICVQQYISIYMSSFVNEWQHHTKKLNFIKTQDLGHGYILKICFAFWGILCRYVAVY